MAVHAQLLRVWGTSLTFAGCVICALSFFEWLFKFRRTLRPNKLFVLVIACLIGSINLTISGTRLAITQPNQSTMSTAVVAAVFLQVCQGLLWRCLLQRLHSVVQRFTEAHMTYATYLVVTYCTVTTCFIFVGAHEAEGSAVKLIMGKWYEKWYRGFDGIDLAVYGFTSFCTDMFLLRTLHKNMTARKDRSTPDKTLKLRIQSTLVICNLVFKLTDLSVKIASFATAYFPFDTYFRSFSTCFETWTVLKLGVTVEDVLKGDGWDKISHSDKQISSAARDGTRNIANASSASVARNAV